MRALVVFGVPVDQHSQLLDVGPNDLLVALMLDHSAADAIAAQAGEKEQKATSVKVVSGL